MILITLMISRMENGIMENNQWNLVRSNHFQLQLYDIIYRISTMITGNNVKII